MGEKKEKGKDVEEAARGGSPSPELRKKNEEKTKKAVVNTVVTVAFMY